MKSISLDEWNSISEKMDEMKLTPSRRRIAMGTARFPCFSKTWISNLKSRRKVWRWKEEGQQDQEEDSHPCPPWQQKQQHNHLLGGSDQLEPMFSTSLIPFVPFNQTLPVLRVKVVHFPEHGTSGKSLLVGSLSTSTTRTAASTTTSTTMLMARGSMTVCVDAIII